MQPTHRLQSFRKEIRREHLDSVFSAKRIKLLETAKLTEPTKPEIESQRQEQESIKVCSNEQELDMEELRRMAKLSQTQNGIEIMHKSQYQPRLLKYLHEEYAQSEEQYYSTYILCNLYYSPLAAPSQPLTQAIAHLLDHADMRTLENLFFFFNNVISNYPNWITLLITSHSLVERFVALFRRFEKPTLSYLNFLVQIVFKCLQRAGREQKFLKLKLPLIKLIMQKQSPDLKELIKKAAYCYYLLAKQFPAELTPNIAKFGILPKLIELTAFFAENRYATLVLETIEVSIEELSEENVHHLVMPYLSRLGQSGFDFGDKNPVFQARQLKIQTCRLLNQLLQSGKLSVEHFASLKLGEVLLQELQSSQDRQLLVELSYVFAQVLLNSSNQELRGNINRLIQRAQLYNYGNFEFNAYVQNFTSPL